jgi:hypothetical protein
MGAGRCTGSTVYRFLGRTGEGVGAVAGLLMASRVAADAILYCDARDLQVAVVLLHGSYHFKTSLNGDSDTTPS